MFTSGIVLVLAVIFEPPEPPRIGRIVVQGNTVTDQRVILAAVGLQPGQLIKPGVVLSADRAVRELNLFEFAPKVKLEPQDENSPFYDLVVTVKETHTGSLRVERRGCSLVVVAEERNFDPTRIPTDFADIWSGKAFRGGGLKLGAEVWLGPRFPWLSVGVTIPDGIVTPAKDP